LYSNVSSLLFKAKQMDVLSEFKSHIWKVTLLPVISMFSALLMQTLPSVYVLLDLNDGSKRTMGEFTYDP
jgi:hypothetical protein